MADLREIEKQLRRLAEQVVPGWYAGACKTCGLSTYVVPGLSWVTCIHHVLVTGEDGRRRTEDVGCGATTYARDHLEVVLDEARDWVAPPKRIAETLVALLDSEPSVPKLYTRIRQWAHGEQLRPIYRHRRGYGWSEDEQRFVTITEEAGHARYRLGEVLDLVLRDTRRLTTDSRRAS